MVQTGLVTVEELERMPDEDAQVELVRGVIVRMPPAGHYPSSLAHPPFCDYEHVHGPPISSLLPGPDGQPITRSEHLGECGYGPPNFYLVDDPRSDQGG